MTERVCNQVPEVIIRKIAEAANSWCAIREIEKRFGDQDGSVGRDLRSAEIRMRAAMCDLPDPPDGRLPWDHPAVRNDPFVESRAQEIYKSFVPGVDVLAKRPWVEGGNAQRQDDARALARTALRREGYYGEGQPCSSV